MARKIDFDGESAWSEDLKIYQGGFPAIPLHLMVRVIPDNKGGAFVGWRDDRFFTNYETAYVSHITSDGRLGFTAGVDGQATGYNEYLRQFSPEMYYSESEDCLYTVWRVTTAAQGWQGVKIQKLAMSGELLWSTEGEDVLPLTETTVGYNSISGAPEGGVKAFYMTLDS